MSYNREYPYNDAGRMDTDWLINQVKELAEKLKEGVGYRLSIDGRILSLIGNDGSVSRVTLPEGGGGGGGVTYGLRRNGQVIELRGSDGSVSSVPAPIITVDSHISSTSTNPVQNKAIKDALDNKADIEDIPSIPTRLPNPNALTFTGAASGSYDGTSPLTVNIPEGGGGATRTWTKLATVDCSEVPGDIVLNNLDEYTAFTFKESNVMNNTSTSSGYAVAINNTRICGPLVQINKTATNSYQYTHVYYDGLTWQPIKKAGSIADGYVNQYVDLLSNYSEVFGVGAATAIKLEAPALAYRATSGIIEIWGGK